MFSISASVGRNGLNRHEDVVYVQNLLRRAGMDPGPIDGVAGRRTVAAITGFQHRFLTQPDGRVDPGGRTLSRLNSVGVHAATPRVHPGGRPVAPLPAKRAGRRAPSHKATNTDWSGDSQSWPEDKKLQSLEPAFRVKVEAVLQALRTEGFQPHVVFGWRSVARQAQLFKLGNTKVHFSFHNAQTSQGIPNALAVDVVDKRWGWDEPDCQKFFKALGAAGIARGLVWGGSWKHFKDWAHLQGRQNSELASVKRESGL